MLVILRQFRPAYLRTEAAVLSMGTGSPPPSTHSLLWRKEHYCRGLCASGTSDHSDDKCPRVIRCTASTSEAFANRSIRNGSKHCASGMAGSFLMSFLLGPSQVLWRPRFLSDMTFLSAMLPLARLQSVLTVLAAARNYPKHRTLRPPTCICVFRFPAGRHPMTGRDSRKFWIPS